MDAANPLGLANTLKENCWFAERLAGNGPGVVVSHEGALTPAIVRFPPTLLLTVTCVLCIAPFNTELNCTGFGLMLRPTEFPPFTVRVTVTVACVTRLGSVTVTEPVY